MPLRSTTPLPDPVELSLEDVMLSTWLEDSGDYLRLDMPELDPPPPAEAPPAD